MKKLCIENCTCPYCGSINAEMSIDGEEFICENCDILGVEPTQEETDALEMIQHQRAIALARFIEENANLVRHGIRRGSDGWFCAQGVRGCVGAQTRFRVEYEWNAPKVRGAIVQDIVKEQTFLLVTNSVTKG